MAFSDKESITQGTEAGSPSTSFPHLGDGGFLPPPLAGNTEDSEGAFVRFKPFLVQLLSLLSSASSSPFTPPSAHWPFDWNSYKVG